MSWGILSGPLGQKRTSHNIEGRVAGEWASGDGGDSVLITVCDKPAAQPMEDAAAWTRRPGTGNCSICSIFRLHRCSEIQIYCFLKNE